MRAATGHWVGFGCHDVGEQWRTGVHISLAPWNLAMKM